MRRLVRWVKCHLGWHDVSLQMFTSLNWGDGSPVERDHYWICARPGCRYQEHK